MDCGGTQGSAGEILEMRPERRQTQLSGRAWGCTLGLGLPRPPFKLLRFKSYFTKFITKSTPGPAGDASPPPSFSRAFQVQSFLLPRF